MIPLSPFFRGLFREALSGAFTGIQDEIPGAY